MNLSLPKLVSISTPAEDLEGLLYVQEDPAGHHLVEFQLGIYDPSLAQSILLGTGCPQACPPSIPIRWNAPATIYDFGLASVQSDSVFAFDRGVAVAASSNNSTWAWLGVGNYGPGEWFPLNSTSHPLPLAGGDGKIAAAGCNIIVTTGAPGQVYATTFYLACTSDSKLGERHGFGGPLTPPPVVNEVSPNCGPVGQGVTIYGSNFLSGATAQFGTNTVATTFISSTTLLATTPSGSGTVDVLIQQPGGGSSPNPPSDQYTFVTGTQIPCVWSVLPAAAVPGTRVTISGYNFDPAASVKFGNIQVGASYVNPTTLTAVVPGFCGTVDVRVVDNGYTSPVWAGDRFTASAVYPSVTGVSPYSGGSGTQVTISGAGFTCGTPTVDFGTTAASGVSVTSYTSMKALAPSGVSGTVDVTVTENSHTSNTSSVDQYSYTPGAVPTVTSLNASGGTQGTPVTVSGTQFTKYAIVDFGSVPATSVSFVSSTQLTCVAPLTYGTVNVTVTVNHLTSANNSPYDLFTYPLVQVGQVYPDYGIAGDTVLITGANIAPDAKVYFGAALGTLKSWSSPRSIDAVVPVGNGTVDVRILENGTTWSPIVLADRFSYQTFEPYHGPQYFFTTSTTDLGPGVDAAPIAWTVLGGPGINTASVGILFSNTSSNEVQFDLPKASGPGYVGHNVERLSLNPPLTAFSSVGSTLLTSPGGIPGQVSIASVGGELLAMYTGSVEGRSVVETSLSTDGGLSWNVTYTESATRGTILDPEVVPSPDGPFFAVWRDNGAGAWEVDVSVFSISGHVIQNSSVVRGSGGSTLTNASSPTIMVDPWERPIVAWESSGLPGTLTSISLTGGFVPPVTVAAWMFAGFQGLTPSDFYPIVNLTQWRSQKNGTLLSLINDLGSQQWCSAEALLFNQVYAMLSQDFVYPYYNATPALCPGAPPIHYFQTEVLPTVGPGAPGSVFAVEEQWLLESLGYGVTDPPAWLGSPGGGNISLNQTGLLGLHVNRAGHTLDGALNYLSVTPVSLNPNTVVLNTTAIFNSTETIQRGTCTGGGNGITTTTITYLPTNYTTYVTEVFNDSLYGKGSHLPNGYFLNFSDEPTEVYMNNLTGQGWGNWTESVAASYQKASFVYSDGCLGNTSRRVVSIPAGSAAFVNLTVSGTWSTELGFLPTAPPLLVSTPDPSLPGQFITTSEWNNTMWATANITTNITTQGQQGVAAQQSVPGYRIAEDVTLNGVSFGQTYATTFHLRSATGGTDYANWTPRLNANLPGSNFANITANSTCSFNMTQNLAALYWDSSAITNVTNSSADLTWYAAGSGIGFVIYRESYGASEQQSAFDQPGSYHNGYPDKYTVELHDLVPWGIYNVTIVQIVKDGGCHVFENYATWHFNTTRTFSLHEADAPYDSLTHSGGGGTISWSVPYRLLSTRGVAWDSGWLRIVNASNVSDVSSIPFNSTPYQPVPSSFAFNATALSPNQDYRLYMELNYTYAGRLVSGNSSPFEFTYLKDTTGDGLTDWEKTHGWQVTVEQLNGSYSRRNVTASPSQWATNGLVNDYVEKEFGLDPTTVETSGSHMLDTWNLTFDLGANSSNPSIPTGGNFQTWNELGHYDWTKSCPYFGAPSCSGFVIGTDWSNVSDSAPWASEVLWSRTALTRFINMSGVMDQPWLRGVLGTSGTERTLTLWGKLSWGANPLAQSTSGDGYLDGEQVNPLAGTDIQVNITGWTQTSPQSGDGVAAFIHANSAATPETAARTDYSGYSLEVTAGSNGVDNFPNATSPTSFVVSFPVTPTEQYASLNLSLLENYSTDHTPKFYGAFDTPTYQVDLMNHSLQTVTYSGGNWSIDFHYQALTVYAKAPTYLLVPGDNSTMTNLPLGLKRYSGEQNFVLLEVNLNSSMVVTNSFTQSDLPYPNMSAPNNIAGQYSVTFSSGITNLLVPRSLFIHSPLGQAYTLNSTDPSIAWQSYNQFLRNGTLPGIVSWDPGSLEAGVSGSNPYNGSDYSAGHFRYVKAYSSTNQNCTSSTPCGGMPTDPLAESSLSALAVNAIYVLNVTNESNFQALLAGLLLNNTGNFTNWFFAVTPYLSSLGLSASVLSALANSSLRNDGAFGAPWSTAQPPPKPVPWWDVLADAIWNAVSGVVAILSAVVSVIWNAAVAAASYMADVASKAVAWGLAAANGVLTKVAEAIVYAIDVVMAAVYSAIETLVQDAVNAIETAVNYALSALYSAFEPLLSSVQNGGTVTEAGATQFWKAMALPLLAVVAIAVAIEVAFDVVEGVSFGTATFVGIIVSTIVGVALAYLAFGTGLASVLNTGGQAAITGLMEFVNTTNQSAGLGPLVQPMGGTLCDFYHSWKTFAESYGLLTHIVATLGGVFLVLDMVDIAAIWELGTLPQIGTALLFALAILGLFLDLAGILAQNRGDSEAAEFYSIAGLVSGGFGLAVVLFPDRLPVIKKATSSFPRKIADIMDGAAFGIGVGDLIAGTLNACPGT